MRLALISDIHGNYQALQAVLLDARRELTDSILFLGDIATGGPQPREVIAELQSLACPCIMGNHDEALLDPASAERLQIAEPVISSLHWCIDQLAKADFEYVQSFERTLLSPIAAQAGLICFHGSPISNTDLLLATTSVEVLAEMFGDRSAAIFAGGHTHVQMLRQHNGSFILNPGSVGQPFRSAAIRGVRPKLMPWAEYAIVTSSDGALSVDLRRVPFDLEEYLRLIAARNIPLKDWFIEEYEKRPAIRK